MSESKRKKSKAGIYLVQTEVISVTAEVSGWLVRMSKPQIELSYYNNSIEKDARGNI